MTKRARRPSPRATVLASLAAFAVILAVLVAQLRAGRDPGLLAQRPVAAVPRPVVIVRRVIVRRIVTDAAPPTATSRLAPLPPVAPAPAPPPVPVLTTRSS